MAITVIGKGLMWARVCVQNAYVQSLSELIWSIVLLIADEIYNNPMLGVRTFIVASKQLAIFISGW